MKYLLSLLLASVCLAELPDINDLTVREQRLICELSKEELGAYYPKLEMDIRKKEALKADLDGDGDVDFHDFAIFSQCWSDWQYKEPVIVLPESQTIKKPIPFMGDPNNLEQVSYYLDYIMESK